jgi:sulfonate transport system substrate-binding protein
VGYVRATTTQYFLIQHAGIGRPDLGRYRTGGDDRGRWRGCVRQWRARCLGDLWLSDPARQATQGARVLRTALGFLSGNYVVSAHRDAIADAQRADWIVRYLADAAGLWLGAANQTVWAGKVAGRSACRSPMCASSSAPERPMRSAA